MVATTGIVSLAPTQQFEGIDGLWSTFEIQVGTPPQSVRLLPGTSASPADCIWPVIEEGCSVLNPEIPDCASKRGNLFTKNDSTTWSIQKLTYGGMFSMNIVQEQTLNLYGNDNAYFGFDTVRIGPNGSTVLNQQLVGAMGSNDFWHGVLGLSPYPMNFSDYNTPVTGFLGSMRDQGLVNSTSWAYTAGKSYSQPPVLGSLTLGGYDVSRVDGNSLTVPMYADISTDLLVGLQSITFDSHGAPPLLTSGIYIFLNSLIAQMWLPLEVCQQFEQQFNLTWNDDLKYYFVSDYAHNKLLAQNPTFTFTLGASTDSSGAGSTTQIKIPYAAFDLNLTAPYYPYVNGTTRYFPLRRAENSTQYTLGRVFFQEAYVVANYDKANFQVVQARSVNTSTSTQLMTLNPLLASVTSNTTDSTTSTPSSILSKPAGLPVAGIAGIAVGIVALLLIFAGSTAWLYRRRRQKQMKTTPDTAVADEHEHGDMIEADSDERRELPGWTSKNAIFSSHCELDERDAGIYEMRVEHGELQGTEKSHAHEVTAEERRVELQGAAKSYAYEMATVERSMELAGGQHQRWELPGHPLWSASNDRCDNAIQEQI
ncbi:hypothetical protein AMS68_005969 [Peltaster fructicola]|uniref:Peptidase A1 domain-containing protein n=1 Tax=Peltaster fructicola TaxID=286661 RepID=A0A6H0Y092_9PEZI|nr:hypothetical protein AMS68_005969 [Peltaster fructicola]